MKSWAFLGFVVLATYAHSSAADETVASPNPNSLSGVECAQRLILLAAKKNVAKQFDNSPHSHGSCAYGVRTSLQLSKVGNVQDSLGNAVDFLQKLKPHGFIDNGKRDPNTAPPGSVLILVGKKTPNYFSTGTFGSPPGDWLGHVTIKGDDGRYYTDGRTAEPALGWENGVNVEGRRNMAAIFVPGPGLAAEYQGRCAHIAAKEQVVDLSLTASELSVLPIDDPASREAGRRLVKEGQEILARSDSSEAFAQALRLARESSPYDDEGEFVNALAQRVKASPAHEKSLNGFLAAQPKAGDLESCKSRVFESSIRNALCRSSGGQDSGDNCPKIVSWSSCLN